MTFKPINPDEVSHDELKVAYRNLLQSRNGLKSRNSELSKWLQAVTANINHVLPHASLVIQRLAELSGVREHEAVQATLGYLDETSHPQWQKGAAKPAPIWPDRVPISSEKGGDAEMLLGASVAKALEPFACGFIYTEIPKEYVRAAVRELTEAVQSALRKGVEGHKDAAGFKVKSLKIPGGKHPDDMSREELKSLVHGMGYAALDLAQDMNFAQDMLRLDLRAAVYRRVAADLYQLSNVPYSDEPKTIGVKVLGDEIPW